MKETGKLYCFLAGKEPNILRKRRFEKICCLHLQGQRVRHCLPKDTVQHFVKLEL
jgi:hypothetical protein